MSSFALDAFSMGLVMCWLSGLLALGMLVLWRWETTEDGFGYWVVAQACLATGVAFLLLRGAIPLWLSVTVGNGLILANPVLIRVGIGAFLRAHLRVLPDVVLAIATVTGMFVLVTVVDRIDLRTVLMCVAMAVLDVRCLLALRNVSPEMRAAARLGQVVFGLIALALVARALWTPFAPESAGPLGEAGTTGPALTFLFASAAGVALPFVLMFLNSLRVHGRLTEARRVAERASDTDYLTGLRNRRHLFRAVSALNPTGRIGLLLLDLDHFKRINDELGHEAGDRALIAFAGLVPDLLGTEDLLVRFGGEEFAVVTPVNDPAQLHALAEAVRAAVERDLGRKARLDRPITTSIGLASGQAAWLDALLGEADDALYRAKAAGRNRIMGTTVPDTVLES
ncbi:MAG: GGDEF domain-containing protein [Pseudomonadota bacterium]